MKRVGTEESMTEEACYNTLSGYLDCKNGGWLPNDDWEMT